MQLHVPQRALYASAKFKQKIDNPITIVPESVSIILLQILDS